MTGDGKRRSSFLLVLFLFFSSCFSAWAVEVPLEELKSWHQKISSYETTIKYLLTQQELSNKQRQELIELQESFSQKISYLEKSIQAYETITENLQTLSLDSMTQAAILSRDLRIFEKDLEDSLKKLESISRKLKVRNKIIIGESAVISVLSVIIWALIAL